MLAVEQTQTGGGAGAGGVDAGDYVYFYDANGNVGQVVGWASGFGGATDFDWDTTPPTLARVVARYEYDPYGNVIGPDTDGDGVFEPDGDDDPGVYATENAWRFSTKPFDAAAGLGYWGERWYNASLGRWMSRDPIEEVGGLNVYAYVENRPSNAVDPYGLSITGFRPRWLLPCPKKPIVLPPRIERICCFIAAAKGLDRGNAGMTICCNGVVVPCALMRSNHDSPSENQAVDLVLRPCLLMHERDHVSHDPHKPCREKTGVTNAEPRSKKDRAKGECRAYDVEMKCIRRNGKRCNDTPQPRKCWKAVYDRYKYIEGRRRYWCGMAS